MSGPSFNLVDEPWISVRLRNGPAELVSLRGLFHRSDEIRRISGDLPTQDFAVLRIALAVMYRAIPSDDEIGDIWESGTLPLNEIDDYLDHWHDRFDLFHTEHPFMQVAGLQSTSGETRPLTILVPDSPGDGALFTMRREVPNVSFAEAARWLVHCQAYDFDGIKTGAVDDPRTSGGRGYPVGVGWGGWIGGLYVEGDDLRETLLHNWVPPEEPDERDAALWELDPLTPAPRSVVEIGPFGPAGLFTWPIRHIRLFPDDDSVTRVLICVGDPIDKANQLKHEPLTSWRFSEPQTKKLKSQLPLYMPRTHDPTRSLWRGLESLLPSPTPRANAKGIVEAFPATVVDRLGLRVARHDVPNKLTNIVSVGIEYGAQMSTYSEIFADHLVVYPAIAEADGSARRVVLDAVKRADQAVSALSRLAGDLTLADGGDRATAAAAARATAYSELDHQFRDWIRLVDNDRDSAGLSRAWYGTARDTISNIAEELLDSATPRSRAVRMVDGQPVSAGSAANWFRYNLLSSLPDDRKDDVK